MPRPYRFIESWLDRINSGEEHEAAQAVDEGAYHAPHTSPPAARFSSKVDSLPLSPPPTLQQARPPSRKRKRRPDDGRRDSDADRCGRCPSLRPRAPKNITTTMSSPKKRSRRLVENDEVSITTDTTATSVAITSLGDLRRPEFSAAASSHASSSSKLRAGSPTRELRDIYRYASPPLRFETRPDAQTPSVVMDILRALPTHGTSFIPASLKDSVKDAFPYEEFPDCVFDNGTDDASFADQMLLKNVIAATERARACFIDNEPEAPWVAIATKLLEDVFAHCDAELQGMLCVKDVQHSDFNSKSLLPHVHNSAIPTKKADLAIAFSPHASSTSAVYAAIRTSDPVIKLSQMAETSVSRLALPGCVEVGEPGKNYLEASLQLGVWCFAGLQKLDELSIERQRIRGGGDETRAINVDDNDSANIATASCTLPLFGWTSIGMEWKLHLAYKNSDDSVTILGPRDTGGLMSGLSAFKLCYCIGRLAKWTRNTYWAEFCSLVSPGP